VPAEAKDVRKGMTIHKYPISTADVQQIPMPSGARILTVQVQNAWPFLWALVDPEQPLENREIRIVGTGHPADGLTDYIGTVQISGGQLVFHVFEAAV
jgi:hypothetical protein